MPATPNNIRAADLKAGMTVIADDGFGCIEAGLHQVQQDDKGFFVLCDEGQHYLEDMEDEDGGRVVGFSPVPAT